MTSVAVRPEQRVPTRVAGVAYLIIIACGIFAEVAVRSRLFVDGDPAATAAGILDHQTLFRAGLAANVILLPGNVVLAVVYLELFKVVHRGLATGAAFLILVSTAIEGVNLLNHITPLILLRDGAYAGAFGTAQAEAQAYLLLESQSMGFGISLAVFGCSCVVVGLLILRSVLLPRAIGALMVLAGGCYLVNSFATFLAPGFAGHLVPYILVPCFVAEAALAVRLTAAPVRTSS
jgi:hypothetical protein